MKSKLKLFREIVLNDVFSLKIFIVSWLILTNPKRSGLGIGQLKKNVHVKIKKNVAISESGYVFNPSTGDSFTVNPIGIEIFNLIKAEKSYEEISKTILAKYNTDEATFEKDYNDFIGLMNLHLLIDNGNEK